MDEMTNKELAYKWFRMSFINLLPEYSDEMIRDCFEKEWKEDSETWVERRSVPIRRG